MDDSDQDFSDLCSRLLKRVRRKGGDSEDDKKTVTKVDETRSRVHSTASAISQSNNVPKKKRKKRDAGTERMKCTEDHTSQLVVLTNGVSQPVGTVQTNGVSQPVGTVQTNGVSQPVGTVQTNGVSQLVGTVQNDHKSVKEPEKAVMELSGVKKSVKEKVLSRMQQFRRASPQRMSHSEIKQPEETGPHGDGASTSVAVNQVPIKDLEGDEALALKLQQELDREAEALAQRQADVDVGDFSCQLCQKDLSALTPQLRTEHINRCLDDSEDSASGRPQKPRIPECPICGKGFKSERSRTAHLKRCSADMGVPPAALLQALQRQATETGSDHPVNQPPQTGGVKRKGPPDPGLPARKKHRKKNQPMDEDTMVALALSRSLLDQEIEKEKEQLREKEMEREIKAQLTGASAAVGSLLQWRPGAGKGRGKRKKGAPALPPPLLLIQDAQAALNRLQERVSTLLLRPRPPSPPSPTLSPCTLSDWTGAAPLWLKSALPNGGPESISEFYTPELGAFIQPWTGTEKERLKSAVETPTNRTAAGPPSGIAVDEPAPHTPVSQKLISVLPQTASSRGSLNLDTQAMQDVLELAEEGMTLTQWGNTGNQTKEQTSDKDSDVADLPLSGFVPEATETDKKRRDKSMVSLSRLASDLSSMVNNPQLSDVQFQVDSGDVFFAHSFMLYARCPLLVEFVHESGFGVQEEGMPAAQRVLLAEVPAGAVRALLQYLYTDCCPLTPPLLPHVQELAGRFDLTELQRQCQHYSEKSQAELEAEAGVWGDTLAEEPQSGEEEDDKGLAESKFLELLRSMWHQEDSEEEDELIEGGVEEKRMDEEEEENGDDGETKEERVNEDELEEIYEFAATQRKMETIVETGTETGEEDEEEKEEEKGIDICLESEKQQDVKRNEEGISVSRREESKADEVPCNVEANNHHSNKPRYEDRDIMGEQQIQSSNTEELNAHLTPVSSVQPCPKRSTDPSLERSYSRLFSESWGDYVEPSPTPKSSSEPSQTGLKTIISRRSSVPSRQCSVSEVIDLSISPPVASSESMSSLPIPGLSPETGKEKEAQELSRTERQCCRRESQGPYSITEPCSPPLHHSKEPELIVLSDSSGDEMNVDPPTKTMSSPAKLILCSSPSFPHLQTSRNPKIYTCIKAKSGEENSPPPNRLVKTGTAVDTKHSSSDHIPLNSERLISEFSKSEHETDRTSDQSLMDGSAEVSWLIPATPVLSTRTGSIQTYRNIRRTQLFPKPKSSASSSSSASSNISKMCSSSAQTESTSFKGRSAISSQSSTCQALGNSPPQAHLSSSDPSTHGHSPVFQVPSYHPKLPQIPSRHSLKSSITTPDLQNVQQPTSSTPLHSVVPLKLQNPLSSPLLSDTEQRHQSRRDCVAGSSSGSPGKLRLILSDNSPSSPQTSNTRQNVNKSSAQRWSSTERNDLLETSCDSLKKARRSAEETEIRKDDKEETRTKDNKERSGEETGAGEKSCAQASFYAFDEPPMAFDDSWGLGGGAVEQGPRFSLRLESSDQGDSPKPKSQRGGDTAPPVSRRLSQPSPQNIIKSDVQLNKSLLDPKVWDDWEEEDEEEEAALPLSQRLGTVAPAQRVAQLKTPVARAKKGQAPLVPITPMPGYSDMDTPELKNRLNRFGVRPLPKKQMVLKLKEIHQYTHQLVSSDSDDEVFAQTRPRSFSQPASVSCASSLAFKQPTAPSAVSPRKQHPNEDSESLSASQASNTSSTAASEESERSNPELCLSDDDDSDSEGITASQAVTRHKDKLLAVRHFILSDPDLYGRILQYQPLVLAELQGRLKAAGIRLGASKLLDFLDSQCITFTTAKPGHAAPSRTRRRGKGSASTSSRGGRGRRKVARKLTE
ncbi:structure-specific endonuclease subunit SLX4 [Chanos chanos]|uniref:Structure-specific endonuclease subunit SLX4 n=1 Tax=Chanos chanos TaxID=29144 RepID=A0A6J2W3D5_CHACN|nr:structure-specific endonuclease subunit SLX4 [Chanos chanos]